MSKRLISLLFVVIITSFVALGCAGDDGSNGATGPAGPQGPAGEPATTVPAEQCTMCHNSTGESVVAAHAQDTNDLSYTSVTAAINAGAIEVTIDGLTMDGGTTFVDDITTVDTGFYNVALYIAQYDTVEEDWVNLLASDGTLGTPGTDDMTGSDTIVYNGSHGTPTAWQAAQWDSTGAATGTYVATFDAVAEADLTDGENYRIVVYIRDYFEGYDSAQSDRDHMSPAIDVAYDGVGGAFIATTLAGTEDLADNTACDSCHGTSVGDSFTFHGQREGVEFCTVCHNSQGLPSKPEFDLDVLVHAIHNGHTNGFAYDASHDYSHVGFPNATGVLDCDTCHGAEEADTATAAVSGSLCLACHTTDNLADTDFNEDGTVFADQAGAHTTSDLTSGCGCHGGTAPTTIGAVHTGAVTAEEGLTEGSTWTYGLTDVSVTAGVATVQWTVNDGGADIDICDTSDDSTAGGFVFTGLDFIVSDFTADDMTNAYAASDRAQPDSVAIDCDATTGNTTVAAGVISTEVDLGALGITSGKVELALQDAPQLVLAGGTDTTDIYVPAGLEFAFDAADGSSETARRDIVDETACYDCHGYLSFHGGNRVNNVQLCATCHNPSATDQVNREYWATNASVDWSTIDGKDAESFDLKVMIHDMHSGNDWFVARPDTGHGYGGIYGFLGASDNVTADYPGWDESISLNTEGWNAIYVRYPATIGDCGMCHTGSTHEMPDPTVAAPVSILANADGAADADQSNDTVIGPGQAVCSTCHDDYLANGHYDIFGYEQQADKEMIVDNQ